MNRSQATQKNHPEDSTSSRSSWSENLRHYNEDLAGSEQHWGEETFGQNLLRANRQGFRRGGGTQATQYPGLGQRESDPSFDNVQSARTRRVNDWNSYGAIDRLDAGNGMQRTEADRSQKRKSIGPHVGKGPKGYQRSDQRILEDVNEHLTLHGNIDASEIEVCVENGDVTLRGTVDDRAAKRLAEDIAEQISGVKDVINEIRVRRDRATQPQNQESRHGRKGREHEFNEDVS